MQKKFKVVIAGQEPVEVIATEMSIEGDKVLFTVEGKLVAMFSYAHVISIVEV